ncbi:MAG: YkgJ family cysteine cluster protein [Deltaproteobacteria bacterium]|nr:YkgJ family cysteine cluster protein [Deltaproteobacteria bacterium]
MITEIYEVFAEESAAIAFACGPGCATCCTRSVTLTTGEGRLIVDFLRETGCALPPLPRDQAPLRPASTGNGLAALCLAGQETPEEPESPWLFEPCFFLKEGLCAIYPVRPFACRSFNSTVNCGKTGMAEAPEWFLTLAIVTNQLLEDLDRGGFWGNLADVLAFLGHGRGEAVKSAARERLLPSQPLPGLLVPPEERPRINRFLATVRERTATRS